MCAVTRRWLVPWGTSAARRTALIICSPTCLPLNSKLLSLLAEMWLVLFPISSMYSRGRSMALDRKTDLIMSSLFLLRMGSGMWSPPTWLSRLSSDSRMSILYRYFCYDWWGLSRPSARCCVSMRASIWRVRTTFPLWLWMYRLLWGRPSLRSFLKGTASSAYVLSFTVFSLSILYCDDRYRFDLMDLCSALVYVSSIFAFQFGLYPLLFGCCSWRKHKSWWNWKKEVLLLI